MEREEQVRTDEPAAGTRKAYQQPAIDESAEFETLALACMKVAPNAFCIATGINNS